MAPGSSDATRAAELVLDAFDSQRLIPPLSDDDPSLDEDSAYAVALEVYSRRVGRGERPVGRKIGFTKHLGRVSGVGAYLGPRLRLDRALCAGRRGAAGGRAPAPAACRSRDPVALRAYAARNRDEQAILESIDWIAQGFEIVQCPFPDWNFSAVDTIAACAVHGALVIGTPVAVSEIENCSEKLRRFEVVVSRDGRQQARGIGANVLGSPLLAFAYLAEVLSLQSRFEPVQAGEVVSTGTLTGPMPVSAGEEWSTTMSGIDLPGLSMSIA